MKQQQSVRYIKTVGETTLLNDSRPQPPGRLPVRLSLIYFTAFLLFVVFAFTHTYFVQFPKFEKVTTAAHVHGLLMFVWFILLIAQPLLILSSKYKLHQAIGKATYFLVPLLLFSFIWVAAAAQRRVPNPESLFDSVPPFIGFALFYYLAIRHKRQPGLHARYMMITPLVLYAPAVARVYIQYPALNVFPMYLLTIVLLTAIMMYEWRRHKVYRPWLYALAFHFATLAAYVFFLPSPAWQSLANGFIKAVSS